MAYFIGGSIIAKRITIKWNCAFSKHILSYCVTTTVLLICLSLSSCINYNASHEKGLHLNYDIMTLQELSLNHTRDLSNRLGIEENGCLMPYLVLSDEYNDNCLLLREYLLDETIHYNSNSLYSAYYENSEVDNYLNNEFFSILSDELKDIIVNSDIVITSKDSLRICGTESIVITRKIFLLSYTELGGNKSATCVEEGNKLNYFKNYDSRIAKHVSGEVNSWSLRTPNTWYGNIAYGVTADGGIGMYGTGGAENNNIGVRPAFCLNGENAIIKSPDYSGDNCLYILK